MSVVPDERPLLIEPLPPTMRSAPTPRPRWRARDHSTLTSLTGFYAGLAFALVVPAGFLWLLPALARLDLVGRLGPLGVLALALPVGLAAARPTRRFGGYMLLGIVLTAAVVLGAAAATVWLMLALPF